MTNVREIGVVEQPIETKIRPPGSKSETIRALAAAAMAEGRSHIYGGLSADDPQAMVGAMEAFGVPVDVSTEPWTVDGKDGRLEPPEGPIDVNESGLTARIVTAMAASADGTTVITGRGRLPERPMRGLLDSLMSQGVEIGGEHLPLSVTGRGHLWGGNVVVDCAETSQYATALMLVGPIMHDPCVLEIRGLAGSAGYLDVTSGVMRRFAAGISRTVTGYEISNEGYRSADVVISPDASAAVYPMAAAAVTGGRVTVEGLGSDSRQPDMRIAHLLSQMGCSVVWESDRVTIDATQATLMGINADMSDAPDGALALAVVAMFAEGDSVLSGLGSLRRKESDRLKALSEGMRRLGANAEVLGDSLRVSRGKMTGAEVSSHGDHRVAMSLALAGLVLTGVSISGASAITKTWPGYWGFLDGLAS